MAGEERKNKKLSKRWNTIKLNKKNQHESLQNYELARQQ
jgi:hypothetical protein